VLKNKLGLRDQSELNAFEALSVAVRAEEPLPVGRSSSTHYRAVHRHLFQDVYGWAGRYRTVRMSKDRSPFCFPENIAGEMRGLFARLHRTDLLRGREPKDFAREAAAFLAYLNAIHPFREGNGRTQLTFIALVAAQAGHPPQALAAGASEIPSGHDLQLLRRRTVAEQGTAGPCARIGIASAAAISELVLRAH
jgi:cell filamentation protein